MTYLRNVWYVAGWAEELTADKLVSRCVLDEQVVMFRDASGMPKALVDRCPHRFAPLSMGQLCDGVIQCNYHGLRFNGEGRCVHNPHGDGTIPKNANVTSYPLVERYSVLWIWMGDPDLADERMLPDLSCQDPEQAYVGKSYLYVRSNYVLESDNILDLSHVQFLHPTTLGSSTVSEGITEVVEQGNSVWSKRRMMNEILPDFLYDALHLPHGEPCDRWFDVRWDPPSVLYLLQDVVLAGQSRDMSPHIPNIHMFTPETEYTTHYWFSFCCPKTMGLEAEGLSQALCDAVRVPFEQEDLPMLQAQQKAIGTQRFWDLKPVLLSGDAGAVRARRRLDQLIAREQDAATQPGATR
jgi:phenylpropionate dioxygenase-like ring-hydroxylating dioxygenase large terminal subunit